MKTLANYDYFLNEKLISRVPSFLTEFRATPGVLASTYNIKEEVVGCCACIIRLKTCLEKNPGHTFKGGGMERRGAGRVTFVCLL
jgi:hypothetical protein